MSVIKFRPRNKELDNDLNRLLKMAVDIKNKCHESREGNVPDFYTFISSKIMGVLIDNRLIERGPIFCGMYISKLLGSLFKSAPEHWVITDYVMESCETSEPSAVQRGANVCFLICSLFPTRIGRTMKLKNYEDYGTRLYMQLYQQTGQEIGFHMSHQFVPMAEITKECISKI